MNELKNILEIFFSPARFIKRATHHSLCREFERNTQFRDLYKSLDKVPDEKKRDFHDRETDRVAAIRRSYGAAALRTIAAFVCGICAGVFVPLGSRWIPVTLQLFGGGLALLATLAVLGWEIQSYKGDTLPEEVNKSLFRSAYWLGTFFIVWGTIAAVR